MTLYNEANSRKLIEMDLATGFAEDGITGSKTWRLRSSNGLIIKDHQLQKGANNLYTYKTVGKHSEK